MEKTVIPDALVQQLKNKLPDVKVGFVVDEKRLASEQEYFCKYALGMTPRAWQYVFWDTCRRQNRVAACTGRQIGKSIAVSVYALQAAVFNTKPVGFNKRTLVIMVSATDEQSKQLIDNIRKLIYLGDENINKLTGGKLKKYFSSKLDKTERNDKSTLTFTNGCRIISLPPTERIRGYSPSVVFIDEGAFLPDDKIYYEAIVPLVSDTGGQIVITTTPNGQQGYFFNLFDPFDDRYDHEYSRLWFDYYAMEQDAPERVERMKIEERLAREMGDGKRFEQEHLALFTSQTGSFFDPEDVDKSVDKEQLKYEHYSGACDLGVDFGKQVSRTVISIVKLDEDNKTMRLLYQYEYPAREDLTLIQDIEGLMKKFNVQRVIFEDCPADETFRQMAVQKGWNLSEFSPQAEKLRKYTSFRQKVKSGKFKMYFEKELVSQMKGMQYEETPRTTKIYAGSGLRDDRVDSVVIAGKYILEDQKPFSVFDWDDL